MDVVSTAVQHCFPAARELAECLDAHPTVGGNAVSTFVGYVKPYGEEMARQRSILSRWFGDICLSSSALDFRLAQIILDFKELSPLCDSAFKIIFGGFREALGDCAIQHDGIAQTLLEGSQLQVRA